VLEHLADVWTSRTMHLERRATASIMFIEGDDVGCIRSRIKSAEKFSFEAPLDLWRSMRDTIHRDVCEKGFDAGQNAFVESYGSQLLDASILLLPSVGFLPASDPRVHGTLAAIEKHMMRDGFVLRHDRAMFPTNGNRSKVRFSPAAFGLPTPMCGRRDRQGAGAVRSRRRVANDLDYWQRNSIREGRQPEISASADAYRADQTAQISAMQETGGKPVLQRSK